MNHRSQPRFIIYCSTILIASMLLLAAFSVKTLTGIADAQQAHARAFIPAKQLASDFERETLNARISFLYFVTIQKPDSLASGWQRYHNAEARLRDLAVLVEEHPDLTDLRAPVATLQKDAANYSTALSATLKLIQGGQVNGPQYEAQVKDWTACGAVLVKDAGDIEKLTVDSEKIEASNIAKALSGEQSTALLLFGGTIFLCFVLALFLLRSASIHDAEEKSSLVGAAQ